jgi:two-component system phosphate regulon response regulator PhoB
MDGDSMDHHILVVEDHAELRRMLAMALRLSGYEISEATSGTEAIEKAASSKPSLIILDLGLPDMSGIDAARAIKKNPLTTNIPIITITAYSEDYGLEEALRVGIVAYLYKPVPLALIKAKIEEFISATEEKWDKNQARFKGESISR